MPTDERLEKGWQPTKFGAELKAFIGGARIVPVFDDTTSQFIFKMGVSMRFTDDTYYHEGNYDTLEEAKRAAIDKLNDRYDEFVKQLKDCQAALLSYDMERSMHLKG